MCCVTLAVSEDQSIIQGFLTVGVEEVIVFKVCIMLS